MKIVILAALVALAYAGPVDQQVPIVKFNSDTGSPDGTYQWNYETGNGIAAQEQGGLKNPETLAAQGSYQFKTPEGLDVAISYVADENGFQPSGNVIPVPPAIPEAILRSLQWNAAHPEPDTPKGKF